MKLPALKRSQVGVISISIFVLTAAILFMMGRTWWGAAEHFGIWTSDTNSKLNSQLLFDPYTFTHIIHGLAFYLILSFAFRKMPLGTKILLALAIEGGWEILENTSFIIERYREVTVSWGYFGDSIVNSLFDMAAMLVGFFAAHKLPVRASLGIFLLIEIILIVTIRDSLLINLVMLLFPIKSLQNWQLGK